MAQSNIEWTEMTWNPTTGCTKVSQGCRYCYAEVMAKRLKAMSHNKNINGFKLTMHPDTLGEPYTWNKPKKVFVNSMSDLFHQNITIEFLKAIFGVMNDTPQHTYQILTKRSETLKYLASNFNWTPNIWMGVSVENHLIAQASACATNFRFKRVS